MTDVLDQFSLLDPQRARVQVNAALGSSVIDQWGILDPARFSQEFNAQKPGTLGPFSLLDPALAQAEMNAALTGGGGYHAKAVHFNGSTFLTNSSPAVSPSGLLTVCCFFRIPSAPPAGAGNFYFVPFDLQPAGNEWGILIRDTGQVGYEFDDGVTGFFHRVSGVGIVAFDANWHSLLLSLDVNHAAGNRLSALYIDDVLVPATSGTDTGVAMQVDWSQPIGVPDTFDDEPQLLVGDLATVQIFPGVSICQGNNTIATADRRNFVTAANKPVSPATSSAAYGTPAFLFNGDHIAFVTNQGSGGAFTLTGTLTDANTSPSD